jgi:hypothetical protein
MLAVSAAISRYSQLGVGQKREFNLPGRPVTPRWTKQTDKTVNALTMVLLASANLNREGSLGWTSRRAEATEKSLTVLLLAEILLMQIGAGAVGTICNRSN